MEAQLKKQDRAPLPAVEKILQPPVLDERPVRRRVGLIALSSDHTVERDFARICHPDRIGVYVTRITHDNPVTPEVLRRMGGHLGDAADLILPGDDLDSLCYACTSASAVLGEEAVAAAIGRVRPGVPVITPPAAAAAALEALGLRRIAILAPYLPETSRIVAGSFAERGTDVVAVHCLNMADDRDMARVSRGTLLEAAQAAADNDAEALFISCTALRVLECIEEIQALIARPVITSNQACIWLTVRRAGDAAALPGLGPLAELPAPR